MATLVVGGTSSSIYVTTNSTGLHLDGVAPGDMLVYLSQDGSQYRADRICRVADSLSPTLTAGQLSITSGLPETISSRLAYVIREPFIKPVVEDLITITTVSPTDITFSLSKYNPLISVGDEFVNEDGTHRYLITGLSPLRTSPPIPTPTVNVYWARKGSTGVGTISLNPMEVDPQEEVTCTLYESNTSGANWVGGDEELYLKVAPGGVPEVFDSSSVTYGASYNRIRPGDRIEIMTGVNAGQHYVSEVTATHLKLNHTLTGPAGSSAFKIYRRL